MDKEIRKVEKLNRKEGRKLKELEIKDKARDKLVEKGRKSMKGKR